MNKRVFELFKRGDRRHIKEFLEEGHLFFNRLTYFLEIEDNELRGDPDEDVSHCYQATSIQLSMEINGKYEPLPLVSQVLFRNKEEVNPHIFCMSTVKNPTLTPLFDPRMLEFGELTAIVTQGDKFIERVHTAAKVQQLKIKWDLVDYVERNIHNGEMGAFRKFSNFSWQSEFRIAILDRSSLNSFSLRIGNISDICITLPTEEVEKRIRISENEI